MSNSRGILLTGATGFLGRYLLADLLAAKRSVAVLVRDSKAQDADSRVAELVAACLEARGRTLSSPIVLQGDLARRNLGLSPVDCQWLGRRCQAVIHSAANLSFRQTAQGEPERTNVAGTRELYQLCERIGFLEFHHISTAFVCGRRTGAIREDELNCGQEFHNTYEESKFKGEQFLRGAHGPRVSVYRPGIIVGDSRTGYTSSFSGLYRLLEMGARLAEANLGSDVRLRSRGQAPNGRRPLSLRLPMRGDEPGHLVPVDWVSAAVLQLVDQPKWHGRTFHLVPRSPIAARTVLEVAAEELNFEEPSFVGYGAYPEPSRLEQILLEGLKAFFPYLSANRRFFSTNADAALGPVNLREIDRKCLQRLVRYAVSTDWGRAGRENGQKRRDNADAWSCAHYIERIFPAKAQRSPIAQAVELNVSVGLDIRGPGGGRWSCRWKDGVMNGPFRGLDESAEVTYRTDASTFRAIVGGLISPQDAFAERKVEIISRDLELALKLAALLARFLQDTSASHPTHLTGAAPVLSNI